MNQNFQPLGFGPADILLPRAGTDMTKWAVVACDQFTSQPEYWQAVEETVGDAPSTLRLILPEARLGEDAEDDITAINATMDRYLADGVFQTLPDALLYLERTQSDGKVRRGLVGMVDLEQYDFTPGSGALIRATEGTVLDRIPPRMQVRRDAPIELPHVMLLVDDPGRTVIEPLAAKRDEMERVYDFDLQQGGGHLRGWLVPRTAYAGLSSALSALADPALPEEKYGLSGAAPMLFAVGDGNHSLAAAKACWEERKRTLPSAQWSTDPARYALAEVVNNHDGALAFAPIHRCLFGVEPQAVLKALLNFYPGARLGAGEGHTIRFVWACGSGVVTVPSPTSQLAVGTLQTFLDAYLAVHPGKIDYIHGHETAEALGRQESAIAFLLPAMGKEQLFKTVMADGVLPRKTFSMGHARDKRYYVEARRIR